MQPRELWLVTMVDIHSKPLNNRLEQSIPTILDQTNRGEAGPQMIVAVIIVIIAGPALLGLVFDIQSAFAELPAFNWFWATLIALLLVGAVVLAALGYE